MRNIVWLGALALALAGCMQTVTLKSPVTGNTVTCGAGPLADINPWSKFQICMESAVSEGYQRVR